MGEKGTVEQPEDLKALDDVVEGFRDRDVEVVCINGGDGTIHKTLTAMVKAYGEKPLPKIALLKGGTMNTVAHGLRIKGRPADLMESILARYHQGDPLPTTRRWLLKVNGEHYGFLFGMGMVPKFLKEYYTGSEPTPTKGLWLVVKTVISVITGGALAQRVVTPTKIRATMDGRLWQDRMISTIVVGSVDDIGFGLLAFFKALLYPGKMHALSFGSNPLDIIREIPRMLRARSATQPDVHDSVGEKLVISGDGPIRWMIDGDGYEPSQIVTVEIGPPVDLVLPTR
jgi:diacylglycerol kinase family enzyme